MSLLARWLAKLVQKRWTRAALATFFVTFHIAMFVVGARAQGLPFNRAPGSPPYFSDVTSPALDKVRREANAERDRLRAETARVEAQIMAQARAETALIIEEGKARIAAEMEGLRKELETTRPMLASEIASRILGREVKQ